MEPLKPQFANVREISSVGPNGQFVKSYTVAFMVGDQGPFTVNIPAADFTAQNVQTAMQQVADKINLIRTGA